ncbi:MAG: DNA polymerase III subunit beta [Candidatus Omnitrophica bacterium]|nr:DNA polymerase III subunit beta [Candidatus Omnitrophota bacterium]
MKIKIQKKSLLEAAQAVQSVVSVRNTLPILSNMLIETQKDKLKLITTDLDIAIICTINAAVSQEGATTVPAKRFTDIIKELPEGEITISAKKNNIITIDCASTYFKINSLPKEDFPKLPNYKNHESITLNQETLKNMLNMTSFAISHDETRYILNGILFELNKDKLTMVATDGRRLAYIEKKLDTKTQKERKMIVPAKTINELSKALTTGEVKMYFGENQTTFDTGNVVIISRLIEGEFPRYQQVIPKEQKSKLTVETGRFLAAAKRANLLTNQDSQAIKLDIFKDRVVISKNTPDVGEAREELEAEYKGGDLSIGFNPGYLIDALKNLDTEKIGFEVSAPDKPGVIRTEDNFIYVVLPMQLG